MGRPRGNDSEMWVSYKETKRAKGAYELKEEEHNIKNAEGINQNYFWYLMRKAHTRYSSKPFIPVLNNNGVLSTSQWTHLLKSFLSCTNPLRMVFYLRVSGPIC